MSDPRFARLRTDPRFRRPRVKDTKVVVDERFRNIFDHAKKKHGSKVDKYGRPVSVSKQRENLKRYYRISDLTLDGNDEKDNEKFTPDKKPDLARGEVLLESSDDDAQHSEEEDDSGVEDGFVTLGGVGENENESLDVDLDESNYVDLDLQAEKYAKTYADADVGNREDADETTAQTSRLAIVNLDWDHVRALHLYKICSSLVSPTASSKLSHSGLDRQKGLSQEGITQAPTRVVRGQVRSVRVYPSEFGKMRMEREEKEGPPKGIFKKREQEVNKRTIYDTGDEKEGEYDESALRSYQLERLRYYYAIVECDTVDAAAHIYNELDGTELERSANVFDLSFVPEGMTFDGEPRDEASEDLSAEYRPLEFVTDALRHSKVKLTWDDGDPERHQLTRRPLTKKEIEEGDFRNYVAGSSDSSASEDENERRDGKKVSKGKKSERSKLRALLLVGNDDMPEDWGFDDREKRKNDVDVEVTFMPAMRKRIGDDEETTLEKYQRKIKEKRKVRKEGKGKDLDDANEKVVEDEFFEAGLPESDEIEPDSKGRKEATSSELALLVAPDTSANEPKHFNFKSVIKAEKDKKRKGKQRKQGRKEDGDNEAQENFVMDFKDERFKALFEDHQFAVDPSNPHFKKTKAMTAILEERQRRRRDQTTKAEEGHIIGKDRKLALDNSKNLQDLVASVKRKIVNADSPGIGKRRKL